MINIEDIEDITRLAIQAKVNGQWITVHNFPLDTKCQKAFAELEDWKKTTSNSEFRLISADIIVDITVMGM